MPLLTAVYMRCSAPPKVPEHNRNFRWHHLRQVRDDADEFGALPHQTHVKVMLQNNHIRVLSFIFAAQPASCA
jgi:hypothetical protein